MSIFELTNTSVIEYYWNLHLIWVKPISAQIMIWIQCTILTITKEQAGLRILNIYCTGLWRKRLCMYMTVEKQTFNSHKVIFITEMQVQ